MIISSVAQSWPTLCDPMNHSTPGLPVHHQLPEFTQSHVHRVSDAIQPSHPWSSPSPPAPNPSQHQSLLQWVNSSHEVANSPLYISTTTFFIHSSVDGHLGCFLVLAIVNSAAMNIGIRVSFSGYIVVFSGYISQGTGLPVVGLLGHMVVLFLVF